MNGRVKMRKLKAGLAGLVGLFGGASRDSNAREGEQGSRASFAPTKRGTKRRIRVDMNKEDKIYQLVKEQKYAEVFEMFEKAKPDLSSKYAYSALNGDSLIDKILKSNLDRDKWNRGKGPKLIEMLLEGERSNEYRKKPGLGVYLDGKNPSLGEDMEMVKRIILSAKIINNGEIYKQLTKRDGNLFPSTAFMQEESECQEQIPPQTSEHFDGYETVKFDGNEAVKRPKKAVSLASDSKDKIYQLVESQEYSKVFKMKEMSDNISILRYVYTNEEDTLIDKILKGNLESEGLRDEARKLVEMLLTAGMKLKLTGLNKSDKKTIAKIQTSAKFINNDRIDELLAEKFKEAEFLEDPTDHSSFQI